MFQPSIRHIISCVSILFLIVALFQSVFARESKPFVCGRSWKSITYQNPDGSRTDHIFSDFISYWDSSEFKPINPEIIPSDKPFYDYMVKEGLYEVYFKEDPTEDHPILYQYNSSRLSLNKTCKTGSVIFQPMGLHYRTEPTSEESKNVEGKVRGKPEDNKFIYSNIFGEGIDLVYTYYPRTLEETLILRNNACLTHPPKEVVSKANITLDLDFAFEFHNIDLFINDEQWDRETKVRDESIQFKSDGRLLFFFPKAYAYDSMLNATILDYELKRSESQISIRVKVPYSWLSNKERVYPIYIDPTETLKPDADVNEAFSTAYSQWGSCFTSPDDAIHEVSSSEYTALQNDDSAYLTDQAGCNFAGCGNIAQKFTFDTSEYSSITDVTCKWKGYRYYDDPNLQKIQIYKGSTSSWEDWKTFIPTSETAYQKSLDDGSNYFYSSTWIKFGLVMNVVCRRVERSIGLKTNYAWLEVTYTEEEGEWHIVETWYGELLTRSWTKIEIWYGQLITRSWTAIEIWCGKLVVRSWIGVQTLMGFLDRYPPIPILIVAIFLTIGVGVMLFWRGSQ